MNHLVNILLISMFCVGWCRLLKPEMLLENLSYIIELFPRWINKPLGLCVPCSASVIGTIGYFLLILSGFTSYNIFWHLVYMVSCVGLNIILWFLSESLIIFVQVKRKELEKLNKICNNCKH